MASLPYLPGTPPVTNSFAIVQLNELDSTGLLLDDHYSPQTEMLEETIPGVFVQEKVTPAVADVLRQGMPTWFLQLFVYPSHQQIAPIPQSEKYQKISKESVSEEAVGRASSRRHRNDRRWTSQTTVDEEERRRERRRRRDDDHDGSWSSRRQDDDREDRSSSRRQYDDREDSWSSRQQDDDNKRGRVRRHDRDRDDFQSSRTLLLQWHGDGGDDDYGDDDDSRRSLDDDELYATTRHGHDGDDDADEGDDRRSSSDDDGTFARNHLFDTKMAMVL
jgi:hypothetical protein